MGAAEDWLDEIRAVVDEQAEDEGLWFCARTATEAYLQQELRKLHAVVEGRSLIGRARSRRSAVRTSKAISPK